MSLKQMPCCAWLAAALVGVEEGLTLTVGVTRCVSSGDCCCGRKAVCIAHVLHQVAGHGGSCADRCVWGGAVRQ
jgi:hypothetical protein